MYTKTVDALMEKFFREPTHLGKSIRLERVVADRLDADDFSDVYDRLKRDCANMKKQGDTEERKRIIEEYHAIRRSAFDAALCEIRTAARSGHFTLKPWCYEFFAARYNAGIYEAIANHVLYRYLGDDLKKEIEKLRVDAATDPFFPFEAHMVEETPTILVERNTLSRADSRKRKRSSDPHKDRLEREYARSEDAPFRNERRKRFRKFDDLIKIASFLNLTTNQSVHPASPVYVVGRKGLVYETRYDGKSQNHYLIVDSEIESWGFGLLASRALKYENLSSNVRRHMDEKYGADEASKKKYLAIRTTGYRVNVRDGDMRGTKTLLKIEVPCPIGPEASLTNMFTLAGVCLGDRITTTFLFHPSMMSEYVDAEDDCTLSRMLPQESEEEEDEKVEGLIAEAAESLKTLGNIVREYARKPIDLCIAQLEDRPLI